MKYEMKYVIQNEQAMNALQLMERYRKEVIQVNKKHDIINVQYLYDKGLARINLSFLILLFVFVFNSYLFPFSPLFTKFPSLIT